MNTYMALHSAHDSYYLGKARHTDILPTVPHHPQDEFSSRAAYSCALGLHPQTANRLLGPVRDIDFAPRLDEPRRRNAPQESRHNGVNRPYPSPPLSGSALRSTVPLPDICGEVFTDYFMDEYMGESADGLSMSHEMLDFREPLSPPPTHLLGTLDLPDVDHGVDAARSNRFSSPHLPLDHHDEAETEHVMEARYWQRRTSGRMRNDRACHGQSSTTQPSASSSRGWSFEGTLSELGQVPESSTTDPHPLPLRADSGFEEYVPRRKSGMDSLPELPEEQDTSSCSKIEPSSYWTPSSPVSMHGHLVLDDHSSFNPAVPKADYRHDSMFMVSPTQYSQNHSTPSWSSMDWSTSSERDSDYSPPTSPRPRSLSLDLPDLDHAPSGDDRFGFDERFDSANHRSACFDQGQLDAQSHSPWILQNERHEDTSYRDIHQTDIMDIDGEPPPSSPRPSSMLLPPADPDSDSSFADTLIPRDEDTWPPSLVASPFHRDFQDLPSTYHDGLYLTPIPRSPHALLATLPDFDMNEPLEVPPAPSSPHVALPSLLDGFSEPFTEECISSGTVAPSLITPPPADREGLGLFLQPVSVDPPLARSPSPDDDDLQFLDVQLDPASSNLEVDEFLELRAVRRRALSAERAARAAEAELGERVNSAANALLPPQSSGSETGATEQLDADEKRAWKRELHLAMDMRAEARRTRKREKQRSKEIGALMDLKMERGVALGKGAMYSIAQLVANMVLRRRDTFRPLANRKTDVQPLVYLHSPLYQCVSAEDLLAPEADMDMDMDMGEE